MDTQTEIDQLEQRLQMLRETQRNCRHVWGEAYRDTDTKLEPRTENRPMGSDFFNPVTVGFDKVEVPVYRRKCKSCGLVQTTTKTEPVIKEHKPVF